jgi:hypothetical protein
MCGNGEITMLAHAGDSRTNPLENRLIVRSDLTPQEKRPASRPS